VKNFGTVYGKHTQAQVEPRPAHEGRQPQEGAGAVTGFQLKRCALFGDEMMLNIG